jgi:Tfp pilus assembly protein PilX
VLSDAIDRLGRRLADAEGFVLPLALGILVALTIAVTTAIYYTSTNARSASSSKGVQVAYGLAEAGVNNAMSILTLPTNNALDKYVFCADASTNPPLPCVRTDTYDGGTVTWSGTLVQNAAAGTAYWDLTSTGYVRNPTGNSASKLKKTIRATIPVVPTTYQPLNNPSWNYVFVRSPNWSGVALSGCDMTLQQSVNVTSPLYVLGNLCLKNTAKISSGPLTVKGSMDLQQSANQVGSASADINQAHIGLGCRYQSQSLHSPCRYGAGGLAPPNDKDNVWATILDGTVPSITPPTVDWNSWYLNSSPGPYFPCQTVSGTPPTFDSPVAAQADSDANKLAYKNNNVGLVNLTPASSYTCRNTNGELSWNASTKVLTVNGTIFIDGSAVANNGSVNTYSGQATIYLSGTLLIKGSGTKLCAGASNTGCTTSSWDSTKDLLCFVVNGNGSSPSPDNQVPSGDSIQLVSAYFEGALYGTNAIDVDTSSLVDGPLDGSTVKLGQSTSSTFSGFTFVPVGMPGEQTIFALAKPPQYTG